MNKLKKILLGILAGVEVTFYMFTPIIVAAMWVLINGLNGWTSYFIYGVGLLATLFRAIKIGWLKNE